MTTPRHRSATVEGPKDLCLAKQHANLLEELARVRWEAIPLALDPLEPLASRLRNIEHVLLERQCLEVTTREQGAPQKDFPATASRPGTVPHPRHWAKSPSVINLQCQSRTPEAELRQTSTSKRISPEAE